MLVYMYTHTHETKTCIHMSNTTDMNIPMHTCAYMQMHVDMSKIYICIHTIYISEPLCVCISLSLYSYIYMYTYMPASKQHPHCQTSGGFQGILPEMKHLGSN